MRNSIGPPLVEEPAPASVDRLVREFIRVRVRRAVHCRWPLMDLPQFPVTRRFHLDTNGNAVLDTVITTQAVVEGGEVVAVIKGIDLLPDADYPATREPSDVPAEAIEHVKLSTLGGC